MTLENFVGISRAAEILGVSIETVRRMTNKRLLTHYRIGKGHRRFQVKDLLDMREAGRMERIENES